MSGDRQVVIVSDNLLDRARIEETARAAGWEPVPWSSESDKADLAVVDLQSEKAEAAIGALAVHSRVVAFGSHVDTDALAAAEGLGADALPRSRFFARLEELFVV